MRQSRKYLKSKVLEDPIYGKLLSKYGLAYVESAGFFDDGLEDKSFLKDHLKITCTPMGHISTPSTKKHCVLYLTGAMCPPHDGHIEMMFKARERLVKEGYEVLGGYMAPSHDSYVNIKNGSYALPGSERVRLVSHKIWQWSAQDWLASDPYPAIFTPGDLNFTEQLIRIKSYIEFYRGIETEIAFVCGGDRSNFSKTFVDEGLCVVVSRPGCLVGEVESPRVLLAEMSNAISSTELRTDSYYASIAFKPKPLLSLRQDGAPVFPGFSDYYDKVELATLAEQTTIFESASRPLISLDPIFKDDYFIRISRLYDAFGHTKLGFDVGTANLPSDTTRTYTLFDDDSYTGATLRFATKLLKEKGLSIAGVSTLTSMEEGAEIQDSRDFVVFREFAGLVVKIGGNVVRVPYVYPFVDPMMRCSLTSPMEFSIAVWKWNASLHRDTGRTLGDVGHGGDIFRLIGFKDTALLYDICTYYAESLFSWLYSANSQLPSA